ncbi:hypothetical protein A6R68_05810 [Neotoma lepida]|uniref:Uncharacterized protein n=1 Tax=Neotoma lepida TaxID=56216 RepID=A0A1A6GIF9_NEOLE|nr:hypothetical protein A6R68_05810 [Neotoma lepida]
MNRAHGRKSWYQKRSDFTSIQLISTSSPQMLAPRFSVWDDPCAGFYIVTMDGVKETQSFVSQNGGASAVIATELQNSTLDSDPAAINALVPVFCGLLITKILVLLALLLRLLSPALTLHHNQKAPPLSTSSEMPQLSS